MIEEKLRVNPLQKGISYVKKCLINKYIRSILLILLLSFAVYQVLISWPQIINFLKENNITWQLLIVALFMIIVSVVLGTFLWSVLLRGMNFRIAWLSAASTQVFSSLAKYIPGYVWQITGKTYLSKEAGIPLHISVLGFSVEVAFTILAGLSLLFLLYPVSGFAGQLSQQENYILVSWLGVIVFFATLLSPILARYIVNKFFKKYHIVLNLFWWYLGLAIIFMGWGLLSGAFYLSVRSLGVLGLTINRSAVIVSASYISGLIAFFAPNGIVIREAVMVELFPVGINQTAGLVIGIIMRIETIIAELFLGLIVLFLKLIIRKNQAGFPQ